MLPNKGLLLGVDKVLSSGLLEYWFSAKPCTTTKGKPAAVSISVS